MRANAVFNLTQDDPSTFKKPYVELPASDPDQGKLGAMEIKSAWRRLNVDPNSPFFDDPRRFYTAEFATTSTKTAVHQTHNACSSI